MKRKKRSKTNFVKPTVAIIAGTITTLIIPGCGDDPLAPAENAWFSVGVFPIPYKNAAVNSIATEGGRVWAVTSEYDYEEQRRKTKIFSYSERFFNVEYESPPEYESANLYDIAIDRVSDKVWAVGVKLELNKPPSPFLLVYHSKLREWKEEKVIGFNELFFNRVMVINQEEIWVLADNSSHSGCRAGLLAKYSLSNSVVYENLGPVTAIYPYTRYTPQTLYAVTYSENGLGPGELPKVYISADKGASWAVETIPADSLRGRTITRAYAGAGYGRDVYILAECGHNGWAIIKRTGPPGAGEYSLAFFAHGGPYLNALNDIAFRDPNTPPRGISADGIAVGRETSVMFDEGNVYLEKLPYPLDFRRVIGYGGNGFFGVALNEGFGGWELLYHP